MTIETLRGVVAKPFEFTPPPTNEYLHDKAKQIALAFGKSRSIQTKSGAEYRVTEFLVPLSSSIEERTIDNTIIVQNFEIFSKENPNALPVNRTLVRALSETSDPKPYYYTILPTPYPGKEMYAAKPFTIDSLVEFNPLYSSTIDSNSAIVQVGKERNRITPIQARQVDSLLDFFAEAAQAYQNLAPIESTPSSAS